MFVTAKSYAINHLKRWISNLFTLTNSIGSYIEADLDSLFIEGIATTITPKTSPTITKPDYIVGLAYYELGDKTVYINIPATIPQNTALVITLYEAYHPGFRQQYDANVIINGPGKNHIKSIIWSTYKSALHFQANAVTKRLSYAGYQKTSANKVAQTEFGKAPNLVLSSYKSPVQINVPSNGN